ncbi:MAG: tetratricopeptide repeat protein [Limisphaerales bacterium]
MDYRDKPLTQPDIFYLNAASGWLGLGDLVSANDELKQISPAMREHPAVLLAQCEILFAAKQWTPLLAMTGTLLQQFPKLDFIWINRSYALHELNRTQEAFDALLPAAKKFPKEWLIRYNLACYSSQLGQVNAAMKLLKQAIRRAGNKEIKAMALEDHDLKPLWKEIMSL